MKNRLKYFDVSTQVIADILKMASENALPDDAQIIRVEYSLLTNCWRMVIHSKKFGIVPEAAMIPRHGTPIVSCGMLK